MRLKQYVEKTEYQTYSDFLILLELARYNNINEGPSEEILTLARQLGSKLGFKVDPTDTIFDYLKRAGRGAQDLMRLSALFLFTDITDNKSRKDIIKDAKKVMKGMNKQEIAAFLMQIDRGTIGITAHIRHVLMSFFGIDFTTFNQWKTDMEYVKDELEKIKYVVGKKLKLGKSYISVLDKFQNMIDNLGTVI